MENKEQEGIENGVSEYRRPEIKDYGDLQELTNATSLGLQIDLPLGSVVADHDGHLDTFS